MQAVAFSLRLDATRAHMLSLKTPVAGLPTVTAKILKKLEHLKIRTIADLLFYYPWRYDDFSKIYPINTLTPGLRATVRCRIEQIVSHRSHWRRRFLVEAVAADQSGSLRVIWFNQPFLVKNLKIGDQVLLAGRVENDRFGLVMMAPVYEKVRADRAAVHAGRLVPIYNVTAGLTNKQLRFLISRALAALSQVSEWLPQFVLKKYQLSDLQRTIKNIHFPASAALLDGAKERLKFEELFLMQLRAVAASRKLQTATAPALAFKETEIKNFVAGLPFKLTNDQRAAAWEILKDLQNSHPMNRLLEGDVGSGKTAVAAMAIYNAVLNGYQAALLAPTEILAQQHAQTLSGMLASRGVKIGLLTASNRRVISDSGKVVSKREMKRLVKEGELDLIIGTHALLQEEVEFKNLALCLVDEQHRFGVSQRQSLQDKGPEQSRPHFLSMTATPIPRSLALAIYGNLDLSIIKHLPPGRRPIVTKLVAAANRQKAYDFIHHQVEAGRQVFVICPLIEPAESGTLQRPVFFNDRKAVIEEFARLTKQVWPDLKIAALHGKMRSKEKELIMADFLEKKYQVLVATSVVEVGLDVPNASVMMIEGAENFGLAQLHQFRGRVGRGPHQSYCFLFSSGQAPPHFSRGDDNIQQREPLGGFASSHQILSGVAGNGAGQGQKVKERLDIFCQTLDGFALAEKDLAWRGPGEVYGLAQSGFPELKFASLDDLDLIKKAREAAADLLEQDPDLDRFTVLAGKLREWQRESHLE